jgi:hypothetical protein
MINMTTFDNRIDDYRRDTANAEQRAKLFSLSGRTRGRSPALLSPLARVRLAFRRRGERAATAC